MKLQLEGSIKVVLEYFEYALNMILYQRNIYPHEMFTLVRKYGINVLKTEDPSIQKYLFSVLIKVKDWIETGQLKKLVLAIINENSGETVEKWEFSLTIQKDTIDIEERDICRNIQYILKQIVSSCTALPILDSGYTFHVLAHTLDGTSVPNQWIKSNSHDITDGEFVHLKAFSTTTHDISTSVEFKTEQ
eukprot:NODE_5_length_49639_cov_0.484336.p20 type:complete len:190 gc:universal NODE_5_length_49639_cov_0.484336:12964-13533(+)